MFSFGAPNPKLTASAKALANLDAATVHFTRHAEVEMDKDGFDHMDVLRCLQKGVVFGPELRNYRLRANVLHRGIRIRVVIGGLDGIQQDWGRLQKIKVITVMVAK